MHSCSANVEIRKNGKDIRALLHIACLKKPRHKAGLFQWSSNVVRYRLPY